MKYPLLFAIAGCVALAQAPSFEVLQVRPKIYMLASDSGNMTLQVGDAPGHAGVVLVDSGSAPLTARILSEIRKITAKPVLFIINTSADEHHIGANQAISAPVPAQNITRQASDTPPVAIFAQDNVLACMSATGSGIASAAWPTITFEEQKDFPSNGEAVQLIAEATAHTDGDSIVFFRSSNVISTGDIVLTTGYPVIDLKRGGSIQGEIKALNHILELAVPELMQEGGTLIIPGQGRLCDEADVVEYRDMVTILRDRVADLLKRGKSLEEVKAAKVSRDFDGRYSAAAWTGDMFMEAIYRSLGGTK